MKIKLLYDNCLGKPELKAGWGFSSMVETDYAPPLLFDTGADGDILLYNMNKLGIIPEQIKIIVISHAHGDHTGGLSDILKLNKNAKIYVPASSAIRIAGRKVIPVSRSVQILNTIFTTGELRGIEQSLVIKTVRGVVVVTGCSHPGVGTILEAASYYGKIYGIIGGLHGFHDFSLLDGLSLICPCHCTQYKSEVSNLFPTQYMPCGAGLELEL